MPAQPLRIALLGCGVVGTEVARLLREQADDLAARVGAPLELVGIAVRDAERPREGVDPALLTTDAEALVDRADIVVEVIGGIEPAHALLLRAVAAGASVVTANKALLAADGPSLYAAADAAGVDVYFEAAVAGAIPIVRPVRESLAGDRVRRIVGIVNGTTNYVLDQMATERLDLDEAVRAGAGPRVRRGRPDRGRRGLRRGGEGRDPRLAGLPHPRPAGRRAPRGHHRRHRRGRRVGGRARVTWSSCSRSPSAPTTASRCASTRRSSRSAHPLAGVRGAFNAVFVEAESAGELMFYGRGAGGAPTASAVLGRRRLGGPAPGARRSRARGVQLRRTCRSCPRRRALTRYQVRVDVARPPGRARAGRRRARRPRRLHRGGPPDAGAAGPRAGPDGSAAGSARGTADDVVAHLVLTTHTATDAALAATVEAVAALDVVRRGEVRPASRGKPDGARLARDHRRVRGPAARPPQADGRHAGRGRHAAGAGARAVGAHRRRGATSRSRA